MYACHGSTSQHACLLMETTGGEAAVSQHIMILIPPSVPYCLLAAKKTLVEVRHYRELRHLLKPPGRLNQSSGPSETGKSTSRFCFLFYAQTCFSITYPEDHDHSILVMILPQVLIAHVAHAIKDPVFFHPSLVAVTSIDAEKQSRSANNRKNTSPSRSFRRLLPLLFLR